LERVNTELSTGSALNIEKEVTSKAIVLTFSPITKDYELKSRTGGCHFKHKMGIEFITKSTEEIKKDLMSILEEKKGNSNLIIQLGSPTEFQKLQNIRVAIDEINAAAREMTRSSDFSKAGEASRSAIEEESNHSIAEKPAKYSFVNVLVIMHLSTHSIELRKLNNLPGLNFWFGWELRVIEKLDMNSVHVKIQRNSLSTSQVPRPVRFNRKK
jgi:hypothetical protein